LIRLWGPNYFAIAFGGAAGASRREAAEHFEMSLASAVKWLQRWHENKGAAPKPRGGSLSPLEQFTTEILALAAEQPDPTLVEIVAELRKRRIKTSRSSLWRFLDRLNDETAVSTNLVRLKGRGGGPRLCRAVLGTHAQRNDIVVMDNCRVHLGLAEVSTCGSYN